MTGYKIFLTRSAEIASQLSEFNSSKIGSEGLDGVKFGPVDQMKEYFPEIYHNIGLFCCILTYESDKPSYNIIIA